MTSSEEQPERPVPAGYPTIVARGDALDALERAMSEDATLEAGGVLVGNAAPSTNFVLITGSLPAQGYLRDNSFTFGDGELEELGAQVHQLYPGQRIVGWYHGHPNFGVFMSAHDVYLHSTYFAQNWTIAYVFDPIQGDRGFFGWANRELVRIPRWEVTATAFASSDLPAQAVVLEPEPLEEPILDEATAVEEPELLAEPDGDFAATSAVVTELPPPMLAEPVAEPESPASPASNRGKLIAGIILAAIVAIIIGVIVVNSGDDEPSATSSETVPSVVETEPSATQPEEASSTSAAGAESTTTAASTASSVPAGGPISVPPTPTSVQAPAARVGSGAAVCEETGAGTYEPIADCFVPLANGNIVLFTAGSLRCVDPADFVLAAEAQQFTVGVEDDPLAITADGALVPKCADVTYARNIMAGGSETLDGLCGASGAQVNEGTARCFGMNPNTGSMAAIVRGTADQTALVGACYASDGSSDTTELEWSNEDVSTMWTVDALRFDSAANNFTAEISRPTENAEATSSLSCN